MWRPPVYGFEEGFKEMPIADKHRFRYFKRHHDVRWAFGHDHGRRGRKLVRVQLIRHGHCHPTRSTRCAMAPFVLAAALRISSTSRLIVWAARRMSSAMARAAWLSRRLVSAARSIRFVGDGGVFWSAAMVKGPSSLWSGLPRCRKHLGGPLV